MRSPIIVCCHTYIDKDNVIYIEHLWGVNGSELISGSRYDKINEEGGGKFSLYAH